MIIRKERFDKIYKENKVECTCLVLILNDECNAECRACIARHVFKSPLCKNLCEAYDVKCKRCCSRTADDDTFYRSLEGILATINSPIVDIIITGGEPTISPRLIPTLELIEKFRYPVKILELETNGANLKSAEIVDILNKYKVRIHLSRYGATDEENDAEFRYKYSRVTANDIRELSGIYGELLGISTVLLNHHIKSGKELISMMDFYNDLGVKHFAFLEVMADPSLRKANPELLNYYESHLISITQLTEELVSLGAVKIAESGGGSYKMITHKYKGLSFTLTSSNLERQHKQETSNAFSRFLIMPSGDIGVNGVEIR